MFKKLRVKFVTTLMILFTAIVIAIFSAIYIGISKNGEYMIFTQLSDTLNGMKMSPNGEIDWRGKPFNNTTFIIYDSKNSRLLYNDAYNMDEDTLVNIVQKAINNKKEKGFIKCNSYNFAYLYRNGPRGIEMVFQDSTIHLNTIKRLVITSFIVGPISLIFLFIVSIFIANKSIKPVEAAYNSQKRFIADASHELKTPLAIINTNIELINSNEEDTIKNQKKWINYISFQTERMSNLVNNLLYLAKADNNEVLGVISKFNLSDAIMSQLLSFEAIMYENNLMLDSDIQNDIEFIGDKESINQLIGILMDNAIKHSYEKSSIKVELKERKQKILLSVTNEGDTIPKEDIDKIFDRFYRVDKARSREKGGYGLGLSIAKSIVEKYKGKVGVTSENNITTFNIELINKEKE